MDYAMPLIPVVCLAKSGWMVRIGKELAIGELPGEAAIAKKNNQRCSDDRTMPVTIQLMHQG